MLPADIILDGNFTQLGDGGFNFGTPQAKIVTEFYKNSNVLDALVRLTGGTHTQMGRAAPG
jgi:hypothetical protein